jgi:hypothetical protein
MRKFVLAALIATMIGSAGCQSPRMAPVPKEELSEPSCPAELQGQVKVFASGTPRTIPPDLAVDTGLTNGVVGRRLLVSVSPNGAARGVRILSSALTATTFGGTFEGWAAIERNDTGRALDVSPGQLRVAPFLSGSTLQPQTISLDLLVVPGAAPIDEMAISALQLWSEDRRPISAEALQIAVTQLRHFSIYDAVEATIKLEFVASGSRSASDRWKCSVENHITLVDRAAVTPPLWDLRKTADRGRSEFWLALFDPRTGPFRAIFTSPADATGFARWLRQTHSTRVGPYQLGMFRPEYSDDARRMVPVDHSVIDSFQPASSADLNDLVIGRLGEP